MEARLQDQTLWRLLAVTAVMHVVFAVWPSIDTAVSRYFLLADGTFWLSSSALAEDVRMPIWLASVALALLSALMLCASVLRGSLAKTSWRLWAFITMTYLIGPGLLVNAILKQNWGRARPVTILEFGGDKLFTPPFEIAGQCANNCSFVSGEAASAAVMAIVLAVCFCSRLSKPARGLAFFALGAVFLLASGLRVATGRHFLSDVVFAGMFMLILARLFYHGFAVTLPNRVGFWAAMRADVQGAAASLFGIGGGRLQPLDNTIVPEPILVEAATHQRQQA